MTRYLSVDQVIELHELSAGSAPLLDRATLESQVARPQHGFGDTEFYPTLVEKAAEWLEVQAHAVGAGHEGSLPAALEIVDADSAWAAFFPDGNPTPETPLGAAFLWWKALLERDIYQTALEDLSVNPADWEGYEDTANRLEGWALMQRIYPAEGAEDELAYARFMRDTGQHEGLR